MRVSFSACSSPVVVMKSAIGPSRTIRSTRRPVGESRIFNRGLVDNPAFADEAADKHGKHAVLVRLHLVCFIDEKDGVSEGTVVINQGQRAAARQVVHELRASAQCLHRRERFTCAACAFIKGFAAAAGTLCQNIHRMLSTRLVAAM